MNIILIGFMGSGKSSVAKALSESLRLPILDMDLCVLQRTQSNDMHEVFAKGGELLLRETELAIAQEHTSPEPRIIATGAGVVLNKIILDRFKKCGGKIIFLNAAFQTIASRLTHDTSRPLFKNVVEAESLYHFRQPLYLKYADHIVDVDGKSIEDATVEILENLRRPHGE